MPEVSSSVTVAAPLDTVYAAAQDIETLAGFIDDLESVTILERRETETGSETVSAWVGLLPEFRRKVRWTERDVWDDAAHTCRFEQTTGDYDAYAGEWTFRAEGDGTRVELTIRYEYNVPLIGPLIQKLVLKKMQDSAAKTQQGLKRRAEGG